MLEYRGLAPMRRVWPFRWACSRRPSLAPALARLALLVAFCGTSAAQTSAVHDDFWVTDGEVNAMKLVGSTLYIGGVFPRVGPPLTGAAPFDNRTGGGERRDFIAGIDGSTGRATSWKADLNDVVTSITATPNVVYAGGIFNGYREGEPAGIAALDATSGEELSWPGAFAVRGYSFAVAPDVIYAGGVIFGFNAVVGLNALTPPGAQPGAAPRARLSGPVFSVTATTGDSYAMRFIISERGAVRLTVFDVAGRQVARFLDDALEPGEHTVRWAPRAGEPGARAGVYFAELEAGGVRTTRKLVRIE